MHVHGGPLPVRRSLLYDVKESCFQHVLDKWREELQLRGEPDFNVLRHLGTRRQDWILFMGKLKYTEATYRGCLEHEFDDWHKRLDDHKAEYYTNFCMDCKSSEHTPPNAWFTREKSEMEQSVEPRRSSRLRVRC